MADKAYADYYASHHNALFMFMEQHCSDEDATTDANACAWQLSSLLHSALMESCAFAYVDKCCAKKVAMPEHPHIDFGSCNPSSASYH
jgi:hypothetical protein